MTIKDLLLTFREKFVNDGEKILGWSEVKFNKEANPISVESFLQENIEKMVREAINKAKNTEDIVHDENICMGNDYCECYMNAIKKHLGII